MAAGRMVLSLVTRPWSAGLAKARRDFKGFGSKITGAVASWTTAFLGLGGAIAGALKAVELEKTARIYGLTTEELARLQTAAFQAGVSLDEIVSTMDEMGMRNPDVLFKELQERISDTSNSAMFFGQIIDGIGKGWETFKDKAVSALDAVAKGFVRIASFVAGGFNLDNANRIFEAFEDDLVKRQEASTRKLEGITGATRARGNVQAAQAAGGRVGARLNALQRIGGFSRRSQNLLLDVQRDQLRIQKQIAQNTDPRNSVLGR